MLGLRRTPARLRHIGKAALGSWSSRNILALVPALSPLATYDLQLASSNFEKYTCVPALSARHYSSSPDEKKEAGESGRSLTFLKEYGPLGVAVSLGVSMSTLALIYLGLSVGLDPHTISDHLPWTDLPPGLSKMGTFGIALLLNKMLIPFKLPVYMFVTAWLARRFPQLKHFGKKEES